MGLSGFSHWIIILVIVLILFGAGRVSGLMGELGKGIKSFKEGMGDDEEEKRQRYEEQRRADPAKQLARDQDPIDASARPAQPAAPPSRDDEAR
ncbi:MAG TPA: twin-arginine translocase TatA/TatE family subunit [Sphingomicrobium sp.]|nr:twin-arginine translocase TatA/TatE family subunit [Sphingomicrobium sp.]